MPSVTSNLFNKYNETKIVKQKSFVKLRKINFKFMVKRIAEPAEYLTESRDIDFKLRQLRHCCG
jgi:hypothetical protein